MHVPCSDLLPLCFNHLGLCTGCAPYEKSSFPTLPRGNSSSTVASPGASPGSARHAAPPLPSRYLLFHTPPARVNPRRAGGHHEPPLHHRTALCPCPASRRGGRRARRRRARSDDRG